jgi:hypothetical protein
LTGSGFHSAPLSRQRQRSPNHNEQRLCYFLALAAAAFLLAAHRAFISWDNLLRPAAVIPPFFARGLTAPSCPAFTLAHRTRWAAAILARAATDICRPRLLLVVICDEVVRPSSAPSRFSRVSIWRRIESACSSALIDVFINALITELCRVSN